MAQAEAAAAAHAELSQQVSMAAAATDNMPFGAAGIESPCVICDAFYKH